MSLHGSIRTLAILSVLLTAGCSLVGGESATESAAASAASGPSPEVLADYSAALVQLQAGDLAAAESALQSFSAAHPELAGPLLNLALLRMRQGDDVAALAWIEQASAVCTSCAPVWNELGVLHRRQGRFAESEQAYRRAIELDADYALAYYNLAVLYDLYIERPELALENYQQYLSLGSEEGHAEVERWIADLRRRVSAMPTTARAEGAT